MAEQDQVSKVERWAYPFPLKNARTQPPPEQYLTALASADDGFYPLGVNGLWHGGIHFGQSTRDQFDQDGGVRCIADGEVVAFRLDTALQELAYPDGTKAGYSSGFTLVRHRLVLPAAPTTAPAAPPAAPPAGSPPPSTTPAHPTSPGNASPQDTLTFFSLYMHTLDFEGYKANATLHTAAKTLPAYYGAHPVYAVGTKANDSQSPTPGHAASSSPGLRIRSTHASSGSILGWLPQGTKVQIGQTHGKWGKISQVVEGTVQPYHAGHAPDAHASTGWVYLGEMDSESQPGPVDRIYILPTPHKVGAGDIIAYAGEYQRLAEAKAHGTLKPAPGERPLLHVEVFTGDDLNAFITRSRARAQQLPPKDHTLLLISKGARLVLPQQADSSIESGVAVKETADSPPGGSWCKVQKVVPSGQTAPAPVWIKRADSSGTGSRPAWTRFPLSVDAPSGPTAGFERVISTQLAPNCPDGGGNIWYVATVADENGVQGDGWVRDHGHTLVTLKSPWDWPAFDVLELSASVSDMFQRELFIGDQGSPDEIASFQTSFDSARSDATFKKLEDTIDSQGQKDGKITARELQLALGKPWLADCIDHLIVRYESEWGGTMAKWEALNPHMHGGLPVWQAEMKRIDALRFWPNVTSIDGYPADATVYHWHPMGLIGNFMATGFKFTHAQLKHLFPRASDADISAAVSELNEHIALYKLDTPLRRCHFFAQVMQEVGGTLDVSVESLNYAPAALTGLFSYFAHHVTEATQYGRTHDHAADQQAIANRAYANGDENGNIDSGDGWTFRGRGYIQLTHRGGYRRLTAWQRANQASWPFESNLDFEANPALLEQVKYSVRSACFFWVSNKLYERADAGANASNVDEITRKINSGLFSTPHSEQKQRSIQGRRDNFQQIHDWGGFDE